MVSKIGKKWTSLFGLVIGILFLSLMFSLVGETTDVQADGGAYSITLRGGNPADYIPPIPYPDPDTADEPDSTPDENLYDGFVGAYPDAGYANIPGADWQGNPSLEPSEMALCQIVPFFFEIVVNGDTTGDNGITFTAEWATITTSSVEFGFDEEYQVFAAFVDRSDPDYVDTGVDANVDSVVSTDVLDNKDRVAFFEGEFVVSGLDDGDVIVVEAWVVLDCTAPAGVNGNLHVSLTGAHTNNAIPDTISTGNQTIPLLQVGELESVDVAIGVNKIDDGIPAAIDMSGWSNIWSNTVTVTAGPAGDIGTYIANGVTITDQLDPYVELYDDQLYHLMDHPFGIHIEPLDIRTCTYSGGMGGTLSCYLGAVAEGTSVTVTYYTRAAVGVPIGSVCEGPLEYESQTDLAVECPPSLYPGSLNGYDVHNVVALDTIADDITLDDNWDAEPKDIQYPTAVTIESFEAESIKFKDVLLQWTALDWDEYWEGFNVYMSPSEDGDKIQLNDGLILPQEGVFNFETGDFDFEFLVKGAQYRLLPFHTYFFWLEDVNQGDITNFHGPIDMMISPPGKMK